MHLVVALLLLLARVIGARVITARVFVEVLTLP
jgi:hypothetical protein